MPTPDHFASGQSLTPGEAFEKLFLDNADRGANAANSELVAALRQRARDIQALAFVKIQWGLSASDWRHHAINNSETLTGVLEARCGRSLLPVTPLRDDPPSRAQQCEACTQKLLAPTNDPAGRMMGILDNLRGAAEVLKAEAEAAKAEDAHDRGDYGEADAHTAKSTDHANKAIEHFDK
jgi:hypothetical protein